MPYRLFLSLKREGQKCVGFDLEIAFQGRSNPDRSLRLKAVLTDPRAPFSWTSFPACSTHSSIFLWVVALSNALEMLIENFAISQFQPPSLIKGFLTRLWFNLTYKASNSKTQFHMETGFMNISLSLFMLAYLIVSAILSSSTYLNIKLFTPWETRKGEHSWGCPYSNQVSQC